jgi:hypothetical protein
MKTTIVLPLATALASLTSAASADLSAVPAADQTDQPGTVDTEKATIIEPNTIFTAGNDLLGLLTTKSADGTVVAQHTSHMSHASHVSHGSGM